MGRGDDRIQRIRQALRDAHLDALVCSFPSNVLMLSGYWPVVGTSVAVASADGRVIVIVPEDEAQLASRGWAEVRTFSPSSLDQLTTACEQLVEPLRAVLQELKVERGAVAYGDGPVSQPASYSAMHIYGGAIGEVLRAAVPSVLLSDGEQLIHRLRAVKTADEIERIRRACRVAGEAFAEGCRQMTETAAARGDGLREVDVAARFRAPLSTGSRDEQERADGFMFCMSGPNAAKAYGAYARSRTRRIRRGELLLVHCNSYVDGYCSDITRTYVVGEPDPRQRELYAAIFAARDAALQAIRPGARACDVDAAARQVLARHGYGDCFKHSAGHGVGFGAIDANALPRLHPKSPDVLQPGMVFNLEPAIYLEGYGGIRHCDVVALTPHGPEVLTPFQTTVEQLTGLGLSTAAPAF